MRSRDDAPTSNVPKDGCKTPTIELDRCAGTETNIGDPDLRRKTSRYLSDETLIEADETSRNSSNETSAETDDPSHNSSDETLTTESKGGRSPLGTRALTGAERQARYRRKQASAQPIRIGLHFRLLRLEIASRPLTPEQHKTLTPRQKAALRSRRCRAKNELARLKHTARHLTDEILAGTTAGPDEVN